MSDSPDQIRADIERTRRELGGDVDALADKVTPSKIVERQTDKIKGAFGSVRDKVMGAADDAGSSMHDAGSSAVDRVVDVKDRAVAKAEGNPMAVGLIAFGAGLLLASLIPASSKEKDLAANVKEQAQPLVEEVTDAAREVGEHLKEPVKEAATAVKDSAAESVENVKQEAKASAAEVTDEAQRARETVAEQQS
jgi:gas vesicle protein